MFSKPVCALGTARTDLAQKAPRAIVLRMEEYIVIEFKEFG